MNKEPGCVTGCLKGAGCGCLVTAFFILGLIGYASLFPDPDADWEGFGFFFLIFLGAMIGGVIGVFEYFVTSGKD